MADLDSIQKKIISFRNERDWAQFHDPKNLDGALSIEAGVRLDYSRRKSASTSLPLNEIPKDQLTYLLDNVLLRSTDSILGGFLLEAL